MATSMDLSLNFLGNIKKMHLGKLQTAAIDQLENDYQFDPQIE